MKILSYNVRGLGKKAKRRGIKDLIRKHKIDLCCIQETQLEEITKIRCTGLWGDGSFEWAYREDDGRSGGILSIWISEVFWKSSLWHSRGILVVNGFFTEDGVRGVLINVYTPCLSSEQAALWDTIKLIVEQNNDAQICVWGISTPSDFLKKWWADGRFQKVEILHVLIILLIKPTW
ncbi:hypothetical protein ACS0TY_032435 [Phlomoides rotata]